ncbi:hypothetical protein [Streptomyces sp. NPDC001594]|uniref:hypothetical protein n=1 Tax=Streptomyces sp. NPDC001594 TaxID=3364590 RepID=UPI00368E9F1E
MLTLLLVLAGLALWLLCGTAVALLLGRVVRHGEQQDRTSRHTDPHAAYWGRDASSPTRRPRGRHSRPHGPPWARNNQHGEHP